MATGNFLSASKAKKRSKLINAGTGSTCQPVSLCNTRFISGNCGRRSVGKLSIFKPSK
ncbi:Uncharacterised protein [Vibrio cholerae]|nr:Uncharacterised protein [Vibrio cholerae]